MPTIDGVEFLHLMQSLGLNHPVVFFTGFGFEELREAVAGFHVLGFLDKQQDRFTLPERLRGFAAAQNEKADQDALSLRNSLGAPRAAS